MTKRVLLVDDSKTSRMVIGNIVKKLECEVVGEAVDGELGFDAFKKLKPDIVLSDIEMPVLDGHGMLKKIIAFDSKAVVIMITSIANAQTIQEIKSAGALAVLKKPIEEQMLRELLQQIKSK